MNPGTGSHGTAPIVMKGVESYYRRNLTIGLTSYQKRRYANHIEVGISYADTCLRLKPGVLRYPLESGEAAFASISGN